MDIGNMLAQLGEDSLRFQEKVATSGRPSIVYRLPKDLTITLVSGYSVPMRHRIVTRWMELEERQQGQPRRFPK